MERPMTAVPMTVQAHRESEDAVLVLDVANSLAQLLEFAGKEIDDDHEAAKATIARASSLLRVELDRMAAPASERAVAGQLAGWQARRVRRFVDERLDQVIHIEDLAKVAQRSAAYFCRAFKRTFGETPHSYIVRRRLDKAETLMLTSDLPLSHIAVRCGFTDQAHLCKLFRQQYAQSPAAWRRQRTEIGARKTGRDVGPFVAETC
jgi:AraC-like DNA-binding protein